MSESVLVAYWTIRDMQKELTQLRRLVGAAQAWREDPAHWEGVLLETLAAVEAGGG